jgi:lysine-specific demethylase 8
LSDFIHGSPNDKVALDAIARLDRAIVIAGAPGKLAIILDLIQKIQMQYLPSGSTPEVLQLSHSSSIKLVLAAKISVPRFEDPPSFTSFQYNHAYRPFILSGYVDDWPARNEHSWSSLQYLSSVAGRGRVVPVEVGSDYRANDWTQKMMDWHEFLDSLNSQAHPVLYLAQHSLFLQFPALREDIVVPDYVYSTPDHSEDFPGYRPPGNDEQLVINAWLGPKGTISPAHTVC